jgi:flagellar biosynthetic protein FliS
MFSTKINAYKNMQNESDIQQFNKSKIIVSIYENIITHIKQAIFCIRNNHVEQKLFHIDKALQSIELGLLAYLDTSHGEVSQHLQNFYTNSMIGLLKSNIDNNIKNLETIADNFNEIKNSWSLIS